MRGERVQGEPAEGERLHSEPARGEPFRLARALLMVVGVLLIGLGAVVLASTQGVPAIVSVAAWMLGAIILHDAVISPIVFLIGVLARRAGRRVPRAILALIQGAIVIGCLLMLLVVPEIYAKTLGNANPTVLPFDYAARLGLMWLGVAVVTAIACLVYLRVLRVRARRVQP